MLCWPTMALSEVKKVDEKTISMHVDEYRFFITRIKTLEQKYEEIYKKYCHVLGMSRDK